MDTCMESPVTNNNQKVQYVRDHRVNIGKTSRGSSR